jgi:hypothetical protein
MASFPHQSIRRPSPPMVYVTEKTVWEYKQVIRNLSESKIPSEDELNGLGKEGWELVTAFVNANNLCMYFKRVKS